MQSILLDSAEAPVCRYSTKQVFLKFRKFHRKKPVLKSLFNKVAGLRLATSCNLQHLRWFILDSTEGTPFLFMRSKWNDCFDSFLTIKIFFFGKDMIFNSADHTKTYYLQNRRTSEINYELKSFLKYTLKRQATKLYFKTSNPNKNFLGHSFSKHFQERFVAHSDWYLLETPIGIIHLVSSQNFPNNHHFLPPDTHKYVGVSVGKKCQFFRKFCEHNK